MTLNKSGQALSEYIILVLLIAAISITATRTLGSTIKEKLTSANKLISKVSGYD